MKLNKTENALRNTLWGVINQMVSILAPFIIRTIIIYKLGTQYLGLNSLFTSVLGVLNIAELGFGSAIGFYMYRPIAEDNYDLICAFIALYKKCYIVIGIIVLTAGICIMPFLNVFVKGDCPSDINLYILYLIYLADTVLSYFLYAYKAAIFSAHQRESVLSRIHVIINIFLYILQILVLVCSKNYYVYIIIKPVSTIFYNIIVAKKADNEYPNYQGHGKLAKEIQKEIYHKVFALFGHKIGNTVINSSDNIVISAFLGLNMVGMYGNYYYILNFLVAFLSIWHNSLTAGIGNEIIISDKKLDCNYNVLSLINSWAVSWCTVCLFCLYQPFMRLWAGPDNMFSFFTVILLAIDFYVWQMRKINLIYKDAAGLWNEDFWKPYIGSVFNLVTNIILVQTIGINGAVISTIISIGLIYTPWEVYVVYRKIFQKSVIQFWNEYIKNTIICFLCACSTYGVTRLLDKGSIISFAWQCVICVFMPNIFFFLYYRRKDYFTEVLTIMKRIFVKCK